MTRRFRANATQATQATLLAVAGLAAAGSAMLTAGPSACYGATWQYSVQVETPPDAKGNPRAPGKAMLWMPPHTQALRGLFVIGQLGIEGEFLRDPQVRQTCRDCDLGIVYFQPHLAGVFKFWEPGNTDGARFLKALDDLAKRSGHPELARVPWITAGHSTAGIYCRNVAYWKPDRVAAIFQIKSGNFFQKDQVPPTGSLVGIPYVALNGQDEWFGPGTVEQPDPADGRIDARYGHETQWIYVQRDLQTCRKKDPNFLMADLVEPTANHYDGTPEDAAYAALFLRKTAEYRLSKTLPPGTGPVPCLKLTAEDGWLTDPDLKNPTHPPAAYKDYAGDKALAMWHYDKESAEANAKFHANFGKLQWFGNAKTAWLDDGDGWTFKARAEWLDTVPAWVRGSIAGTKITHAETPFVWRCKVNQPVAQVGPDTFRLLRPLTGKNAIASVFVYHPGDAQHSSAVEWTKAVPPAVKGASQTLDFPAIPDLKADGPPYELHAKASSNLPVYYDVEYGPVEVKDGKLAVSEVPANAQFPIECKVTAWQIGKRSEPAVQAAKEVAVTFNVVKP